MAEWIGSSLIQVMACRLFGAMPLLNQCCLIVNWTHWTKLQCNVRQNPKGVPWHDDVIKWKHFPRYWPFVRGILRSPVNSPHKGQWRGALMFSLIFIWIYGWVNNREAGDLRRHRAHYDVIVMCWLKTSTILFRHWLAAPSYQERPSLMLIDREPLVPYTTNI